MSIQDDIWDLEASIRGDNKKKFKRIMEVFHALDHLSYDSERLAGSAKQILVEAHMLRHVNDFGSDTDNPVESPYEEEALALEAVYMSLRAKIIAGKGSLPRNEYELPSLKRPKETA